jgi:hypothetical protein
MSKTEDQKSAVISPSKFPTRNFTLKHCGVVVTIPDNWLISDTNAAQRYGSGDIGKVNLMLAHRICLFNGEKWTISRIMDEITGKDWLILQGQLFGDADDDEDQEKNA